METESTPLLMRPAPWDPRRSTVAGGLVLVTLTLERLAFYALVANLFLFLSLGGWSPRGSMTAVLILVGIAHFSALGGGWLADGWASIGVLLSQIITAIENFCVICSQLFISLVGRYWALVIGLSLYVVGFTLLTTMASGFLCHRTPASPSCVPETYGILICVGIAGGTVRANIPSFGAEQVKYGGADSLRKFFNWYYWCVNTGSLLGVGALSYVALDMNEGFLKTYAGAGGCLLVALILFSFGRPYYIVHRPAGSVLRSILCILRDAIGGRCCHPRQTSIQSSPVLERRSNSFSQQSVGHHSPIPSAQAPSWLDYAKIRYGGSHHDAAVEDVKRLGIILILFICLLPYWLVFFQIETGFQEQGLHLKIGFPQDGQGSNFNMPTAWLSLFDQVFILALIPLMNGVVYPTLDKIGVNVSLLTRIAIGMGLSLLAAVSAGVLEFLSLQRWKEGYGIVQVIHNWTYNATDISLLWQIPQYCLVGSAEVFAGVAGKSVIVIVTYCQRLRVLRALTDISTSSIGLEFAYSAAPRPLQGVAMGMFSAMEGVGSLLGTTLISALSPVWIRHDAQHFQGHLDYYFFLLAGIQGIAFILFAGWLLVRRYRSNRHVAVGNPT
ncbi:hypothetical protein Cfor_02093 [Coptotermes formosanus]|uniref:Major facilitator superfamily (MFS) profile domain-containing protein n=1 Tax=Coptotermes formosanus TaxID=36987 RepID=A0A6L2P9N9_COPFO|nr:hypothetical protein Cfor_02093 [Coptotermes formosanus]